MTRKLPPASYVASSTLPIPPSRASTLNPVRSLCVDIPSRNVQMSMRVAIRPPSGWSTIPYPSSPGDNPLPSEPPRRHVERATGEPNRAGRARRARHGDLHPVPAAGGEAAAREDDEREVGALQRASCPQDAP